MPRRTDCKPTTQPDEREGGGTRGGQESREERTKGDNRESRGEIQPPAEGLVGGGGAALFNGSDWWEEEEEEAGRVTGEHAGIVHTR